MEKKSIFFFDCLCNLNCNYDNILLHGIQISDLEKAIKSLSAVTA